MNALCELNGFRIQWNDYLDPEGWGVVAGRTLILPRAWKELDVNDLVLKPVVESNRLGEFRFTGEFGFSKSNL